MRAAVVAFAAACLAATTGWAGQVGFTTLTVTDGANPPIAVGIWYPATGTPRPVQLGLLTQSLIRDAPPAGHHLPLVVIAHGTGGLLWSHADTAFALAAAGFVAAAPTFTGDTIDDHSRALDLAGRVRELGRAVDAAVSWQPHTIDPARIGAFGFSAGGLTVLMAAGGVPDMASLQPHCTAHPALFDCQMLQEDASQRPAARSAKAAPPDRRIRAIVVAAPALGFSFDRARLATVTMPVQLWRSDNDAILPAPLYADAVRAALPRPPDFHTVAHAGHFDFLAPCSAALAHVAAAICTSEPGFDRARFHQGFNATLIDFFTHTLGRQQ